MHIGLIVPGFSADENDWCIPALLTLVRALRLRHRVTVLALRYPHRRDSYTVSGATVYPLGGGARAGVARAPLLARGLHRLWQIHRRAPFDLLHAFWADEPGLLAMLAARLLGLPAVVSLGGGELERWPELGYGHGLSRAARLTVALSLKGATVVTAGSDFLRARVAARIGVERLVRQPLGVDSHLFAPHGPAHSLAGPALLHVASLVPIKGQRRLIRALASLHARGLPTHLHVVGDGPLRATLAEEAARHGVAERLHWHGAVPHHELPPFYRGARLHVLSSHYESQGMVVLEAGACGLPTVGTAVGLLPELGAAVRRVPPSDEGRALADAIAPLLADEGALARMAGRMQERISQEYALARTVAGWEAIYHRAAGGASAQR